MAGESPPPVNQLRPMDPLSRPSSSSTYSTSEITDEHQRWALRGDEQRGSEANHQNDQSYRFNLPPGYLRQPVPIRVGNQWGFAPLPSPTPAYPSMNYRHDSLQANSYSQSYNPLPYPSPISPTFNSRGANQDNILPSLHHQSYQPMLSEGNWLPSLQSPDHLDSGPSSSSQHLLRHDPPATLYEPISDQINTVAQTTVSPVYFLRQTGVTITPIVLSYSYNFLQTQTAVKPFAAKLAFLLANPNLYADLIMWE